MEVYRRTSPGFIALTGFIEKLSGNFSNQIANLHLGEEKFPWSLDDELQRLVDTSNPVLQAGDPDAPVICTVAVGENYQKLVGPCLDTVRDYCRQHRYHYLLMTEAPPGFNRALSWAKIVLMVHAMQKGHRRILWIDADAMVTNPETRIETFIERLEKAGHHLGVARNSDAINCGIIFARGGWQAKIVLNLMWQNRLYLNHGWWEQASLIDLIHRYPEVAREVHVDPRLRNFNSPDAKLDLGRNPSWEPGDFIVHFPGGRGELLVELIAKYSAYVQSLKQSKIAGT